MSQDSDNITVSKPDQAPVDPDALMSRISGLSFFAMFIVSLLIHTALIGATSVGFIQQCVHYKTLDPGSIIREEVKKQKAEERAKKRADRQAEEAKQIAKQKDKASGASTSKPKSKIEKKITEKSTTLPAKSGVRLDDIDEL